MEILLTHLNIKYRANLNQPIDISIPTGQVKCFYAPDFTATPFVSGDFIGAVKKGAPVNFFNVHFNPHGNGTHTESLGHITSRQESINTSLKTFHFISSLVSVKLEKKKNGDQVITRETLKKSCPEILPKAIIIRTKPNRKSKLTKDYSGTNPPYLDKKAMQFLVDKGVEHVLIDLPSVDREVDKGKLASHHVFWGLDKQKKSKGKSRKHCTITEMIFVDNTAKDGMYLLNLQIAPFNLDASPSKPIIYELKNVQ